MFTPIHRHKDPAVQAEVNHIYTILNQIAATGLKKIVTGKGKFTGATEILIPKMNDNSYCVTITPLGSGSGTYTITRMSDRFIVESNMQGEFLWSVIAEL